MKLFEKIWEDIKHGENIDQYATIFLSFSIGILGLLGITPPGLITSLTLALLGLLAVSNLVNRNLVERLSQRLLKSSKDFFLEEFPSQLRNDFISAKDVLLIGVTLSRFLKNNYGQIEEKIHNGHSIKVLLVHPSGAALEMAAGRFYAETSRNPKTKSADIIHNLQLLCELQKTNPDRLEIRTIDTPLTFGAICVDPDSTSGVLYLEHFPYRIVTDAQPKYMLSQTDKPWYELFNKEVRALWNNGKPWKCID